MTPLDLAGVTQLILDTAGDAIEAMASEKNPKRWTDVAEPPRFHQLVKAHPSLLSVWVESGKPLGAKCGGPFVWVAVTRWLACWEGFDEKGIDIDDRAKQAVRCQKVAQIVERALMGMTCERPPLGVVSWRLVSSRPVKPSGGSVGWEWRSEVTL